MHELGIVFEVANRVRDIGEEYHIDPEDIAILVLEVGEASTIVPRYMMECWPAAIDGTEFQHVDLQIDQVVARVCCKKCGEVYEYLNNEKKCPKCQSPDCTMVTGKEFNIKEILLYEEEE